MKLNKQIPTYLHKHSLWHWIIFLVASFLFVFGSYIGLRNLDSQLLSESSPSIKVADLNTYKHLADVTNQMLRNPTAENAQIRKQVMLNAMDKDPGSLIAVSLDKKTAMIMPKEIQPILEQNVSLSGKPQVIVLKGISYGLVVNNKTFFLHFADDLNTVQDSMGKAIRGSTNIKVSGVLIDDQLIVPKGKIQVLDQPTGKLSSKGIVKSAVVKRLAVIEYDMDAQGNPNERTFTLAGETNRYFGPKGSGSIADYFSENSYGKFTLTGHVYGFYYNARNNGGICGGGYALDPSTALYAEAQADGYSPANYDAIWLYADDCFSDGPSDHTIAYIGTLFGFSNSPQIGTCTNTATGAYVTFPAATARCIYYGYGGFGATIRTGANGQYSGSVKKAQGWFDANNMQTVTTDGIYTIYPYELPSTGVQYLMITAKGCVLACLNSQISLEYRQEYGSDVLFHGSDIFKGATVYMAVTLLDASPNGDLNGTVDFNGFTGQNIAAVVGQTLYDATDARQITVLSADSTALTVQVTYGALACVHNAPTVSVSPTPQWGSAGSGLNYKVSVTNNDNSGCAASIFNVSGNLPAGFTQNTPASMSISYGQTMTALVNVVSPLTANGVNQFSEVATANGISGSGTANFNIATSSSSATFVKTDTSTGANWTGVYGNSGYLTRTANTLPSYVSESLISGFIDGNQPVWFNYSGDLTFDLNLTDGLTHQVAAYVTGFSSCGSMTGESVDVLDASNTSVSLDSRRISFLPSWLVWNMKGHVNLRFYNASNGCPTVTGFFIDPGPGAQPPPPPPPSTYPRTISFSLEGRTNKSVSGTVDVLSGSSLVKSYPFTSDSSGISNITFDVATGAYTLRIKVAPFLTRTLTVDLSNNTSYSFPQLLIGDINQDGIVNSIDYSTLNAKWFTADTLTDLNQDGLVNSLDYSLLNKNWFVQGQ
jgi:hypothetical protein